MPSLQEQAAERKALREATKAKRSAATAKRNQQTAEDNRNTKKRAVTRKKKVVARRQAKVDNYKLTVKRCKMTGMWKVYNDQGPPPKVLQGLWTNIEDVHTAARLTATVIHKAEED